MSKFSYKIYRESKEVLLAISDFSILGRTFEDGEMQIAVTEFYRGRECDDKQAVKLIKEATIINAVGREIINLMVNKNLVDSSMILEIDGVPHAQVITLKD